MSNILGTVVADAVVPLGANATHYDVFGQGGFRSVATLAERDAIATGPELDPDGFGAGRRTPGMLVYVAATDKTYQLVLPGYADLAPAGRLAALADNSGWQELKTGGDVTKAYVDAQDAGLQTQIAANASAITTEKNRLDNLVTGAPAALDTLKEIADQIAADESGVAGMLSTLGQHSTALSDHEQRITANTQGVAGLTTKVGPLASLTTTDKTSLVAALNEVKSTVQPAPAAGTYVQDALAPASTTKAPSVDAVVAALAGKGSAATVAAHTAQLADHETRIAQNTANVGALAGLTTTDKSTLVAAVNEVKAAVGTTTQDIKDVHDNKAVLVHTDRTRVYYTGVGTEQGLMVGGVSQGQNSDDGAIQALKAAGAGDFVQITTPLTMPWAGYYNPLVNLNPGMTLDLNGYFVNTVQRQDCISFTASGDYTLFGRGAKLLANGLGSVALYASSGKVVNTRSTDLHVEYRGSGNAILMYAGRHYHTGSLYIENNGVYGYQTHLFNLSGNTFYDFIGDIRVKGRAAVFGCGDTTFVNVRNGNVVVQDATGGLGYLNGSAQVEFSLYVIDLTAAPTTGGFTMNNPSAKLILTDVSVLGGALVVGANTATVLLRGTTTLPHDYDVAYLQGLGMTVIDQRGTGINAGGITSAALTISGQALTLNTSAGNTTVTLPGGTTANDLDIYDVPQALREAVVMGAYNGSDELLTATTGSVVGMKFSYQQSQYEYMPGDAGNLVWIRSTKRAGSTIISGGGVQDSLAPGSAAVAPSVDAVNAAFGGYQTQLNGKASVADIDALQQADADQQNQLDNHTDRLDAHDQTLSNLSGTVIGNGVDLYNLQQKDVDLQQQITEWAEVVTVHEDRISDNQAAIAAEKARIDNLVAGAPQALDTLAEIAAQIASDETGAAAILSTQGQHTTQLADHEQRISAAATALTTKADKTYVDGQLVLKADVEYVDGELGTIVGYLSTKTEKTYVDAQDTGLQNQITANTTALGTKVDKVTGKGLSTNDYTTAEQSKLAGLKPTVAGTFIGVDTATTPGSQILNVTMPVATTSVAGYLSAADYTKFNSKQNAIANSDGVAEGTANLYFTQARARASVSATAPLTYNTATGAFALPGATSSVDGYLKAADWVTFNGKQNALAAASSTVSGYLTSTDWSTFNGKQNTLAAASSTVNGYLTSADWTTFNGKQNALGSTTNLAEGTNLYYTDARARAAHGVTAGSALTYSSATGVFTLPAATSTASGYLTTADWNTFNGKQNTLAAASSTVSGYLTSADWTTFNGKQAALAAANGTTNGYLTSTDWTTFNNKQSTLAAANTTTNGYLTSTDWNTFNGKLGASTTTTAIAEGTNQYFTTTRVLNTALTGLVTTTSGTPAPADTMLVAWNKVTNFITNITATIRAVTLGTYAKASTSQAVATTDTTTTALGKLEFKIDTNTGTLANKSDVGHTHTASQVTDFSAAADLRADARILAQKNVANGIPQLDASAKVYAALLPLATSTSTGIVKAGTNVTIDADGTLNASGGGGPITPATTSTLGGVIVGNGLIVQPDGTLATNGTGGTAYTLPTASASVLGGVKVGSGLVIDGQGALSALAPTPVLYGTTGTNSDGAMTQAATTATTGVLANLTTTDKTSLVAAVNEVKAGAGTFKYLAADLAPTNSTAGAVVSALSLTVVPGLYKFEYYIRYTSSIATNGLRYAADHSMHGNGATTGKVLTWTSRWVDASATASTGVGHGAQQAQIGGVVGGHAVRGSLIGGTLTLAGVDLANAEQTLLIEGTCWSNFTGDIQFYAGSELSTGTITIKQGSNLTVTRLL